MATKKTENRMQKIKVIRKQNGRGDTFYQAQEKDHKGVRREYTDKEYKKNPAQFEVVGGLAESHRALVDGLKDPKAAKKLARAGFEVVHEVTMPKLPKPLGELNELIACLTPFRPSKTRDQIVKEAERMVADKKAYLRQREVKESWQRRGLTPEAAEVAAKVELQKRPASLPPATEWASLLDKAFGGK
jgi:hypothetical protein